MGDGSTFKSILLCNSLNTGQIGLEGRSDDLNNVLVSLHGYMESVLVPCDCGSCFFCKTGRTTGVAHKPSNKNGN
jgi:hypothetical protein